MLGVCRTDQVASRAESGDQNALGVDTQWLRVINGLNFGMFSQFRRIVFRHWSVGKSGVFTQSSASHASSKPLGNGYSGALHFNI